MVRVKEGPHGVQRRVASRVHHVTSGVRGTARVCGCWGEDKDARRAQPRFLSSATEGGDWTSLLILSPVERPREFVGRNCGRPHTRDSGLCVLDLKNNHHHAVILQAEAGVIVWGQCTCSTLGAGILRASVMSLPERPILAFRTHGPEDLSSSLSQDGFWCLPDVF